MLRMPRIPLRVETQAEFGLTDNFVKWKKGQTQLLSQQGCLEVFDWLLNT